MNAIEGGGRDDDEDNDRNCMEHEAETVRKFAFIALCFASISLLTAVLLIPLIFIQTRSVQNSIEQQSAGCLIKLAQIYTQMDNIVETKTRRLARHVPANTKNKLRQVLKSQRKSRYLQQKIAETAALLNSGEVWEEGGGKGGKSKDDAANNNVVGAGAAAAAREKNGPDEENSSSGKPKQHLQTDLFGSSSSFEISSEQHWQNQQKGNWAGQNGFEFSTTSFPLPPFSRISPRIHSSKEIGSGSSTSTRHQPLTFPLTLTPGSTVGPSSSSSFLKASNTHANTIFPSTEKPIHLQQRKTNDDDSGDSDSDLDEEEGGCCSCTEYGPPGPPGMAGSDGKSGQDGRPGKNGQNGRDASMSSSTEHHAPTVNDFCFNCPRGPAGPIGPSGPKGAMGEAGKRGDDGEDGEKGMPGGRGPIGMVGKPGKPGYPGRQGKPGKVSIVPGPEGPEGNAGKPGQPGPPGAPGQPGLSECGSPGPVGEPGVDGRNGAVGIAGKPGIPGKQGPPGGCVHCNMPRTAPGY